jgi:hypothetical protein
VGPALVNVGAVVEGLHAGLCLRVGSAHRGRAVGSHRDAIRAREGAEIVVEGTVLLHDDDHVLDLLDTGGGGFRDLGRSRLG